MTPKYGRKKLPPIPKNARKRGDPLTSTPDYDADEVEFQKAVDKFKREKGRPFPALSELLTILKKLGWKKDKKEVGDEG